MLVLSRKPGESLRIGRDVTITITQIKSNRVKIGIQAPSDTHIRRSEIPSFESLEGEFEFDSNDEPETETTCSEA